MSFSMPSPPSPSGLPGRPADSSHADAYLNTRQRETDGAVDSTALLRGQKAVDIHHNGATYRLQATRLGKLILTK